jgi:hypothetical protein
MGLRLNKFDELGRPPKNDEDRPEFGDQLPGMDIGIEILPKKNDAHANQGQRPEY